MSDSSPSYRNTAVNNAPKNSSVQDAMLTPASNGCFHCGEPLGKSTYTTRINQQTQPMCCIGCQLASQSIVDAGLANYYLDRTVISPTAPLPDELYTLQAFDHPSTQQHYLKLDMHAEYVQSTFSLSGIRCSACAWLIEQKISQLPGVKSLYVNVASEQVFITWNQALTPLSRILLHISQLGYKARPYQQDLHQQQLLKQKRSMLMRLGFALLASMQAMMYAISVYLGDHSGIDGDLKNYFRYVQLGLVIPLMLFGADVFFTSAYRSLRAGVLNMDVPVSIALILIFIASAWATLHGSNETYFDAVSMFVFLLLIGRYLELQARTTASQKATENTLIEPVIYEVSRADQSLQLPNTALQVGDYVAIQSAQYIPCDGTITDGNPSVSEAQLTGEYALIHKSQGQTVAAGSQNYAQPFTLQVTALAADSQLSILENLKNRALSERPAMAILADRWAKGFVLFILLFSVIVAGAWLVFDPSRALHACIAILVATCPCALALATPLSLSNATNHLMQQGYLITRGHVLEAWRSASHIIFDKTGTLTVGKPTLEAVNPLVEHATIDPTILAASLEQWSHHPLAHAFVQTVSPSQLRLVSNLNHSVANGVEGVIDGQCYRLGHADYAGLSPALQQQLTATATNTGQTLVYLSVLTNPQSNCEGKAQDNSQDNTQHNTLDTAQINPQWQPLAQFILADRLRSDAASTLQYLQQQGYTCCVLTGDPSPNSLQLIASLPLSDTQAGLSPSAKLAYIQRLQATGATVIMVGDGLNDAPVLGGADVSVAMSAGADLALLNADSVILGNQLGILKQVHAVSVQTHHIIRQNLLWSMLYNVIVLPPAALGLVSPWLATLGMSLSSLLVVINARRVAR